MRVRHGSFAHVVQASRTVSGGLELSDVGGLVQPSLISHSYPFWKKDIEANTKLR